MKAVLKPGRHALQAFDLPLFGGFPTLDAQLPSGLFFNFVWGGLPFKVKQQQTTDADPYFLHGNPLGNQSKDGRGNSLSPLHRFGYGSPKLGSTFLQVRLQDVLTTRSQIEVVQDT